MVHAHLIQKLLSTVNRASETYGEARLICLSGLAFVLARGGFDFDELSTMQPYWFLGDFQRYAQSMLANLLYGRELARR